MLPVILGNNNGVQLAQNSQGLNGFWGRLAKSLLAKVANVVSDFVASALPGTGLGESVRSFLIGQISRIPTERSFSLEPGGLMGAFVDYEPTPSEEAILTAWVDSKFLPYYKKTLIDLTAGLTTTTIQSQFDAINIALARMNVPLQYFDKYESTGLSTKAVQYRNAFMQEAFDGMFRLINNTVDPYMYDETAMWLPDYKYIQSHTLSFSYLPLIAGNPTGVTISQIFIRGLVPNHPMIPGYVPQQTPTPPVLPPTLPPATTTPVTPTPTPSTPVVTNPTNPTVPAKADQEKSFFQKYKIPLLAIGAVALLWPEDEKKKVTN